MEWSYKEAKWGKNLTLKIEFKLTKQEKHGSCQINSKQPHKQ